MGEPPRHVGVHAAILPVLRWIPWILALLFLASFAWDFDGLSLSVGERVLRLDGGRLRELERSETRLFFNGLGD